MFKSILLSIVSYLFVGSSQIWAETRCERLFQDKSTHSVDVQTSWHQFQYQLFNENSDITYLTIAVADQLSSCPLPCNDKTLAKKIFQSIRNVPKATYECTQKHKGYAIIIAAMIGSAALTSHLTSALPGNYKFLSQLLSQVSTLGIFVFGAPIWDPISSKLRKFAFGIGQNTKHSKQNNDIERTFEATWTRMYEENTPNTALIRGIITQFLALVHQNFSDAYRAIKSSDYKYAAAQIAGAAIRQHVYFKEILPDDQYVAMDVQAAFSNHINGNDKKYLTNLVWEIIKSQDPSSINDEKAQEYYTVLLKTWLNN